MADSSQQTTSVAALVGSIKARMTDIDHRLRKIEAQRSMFGRSGLARIWWEIIPPPPQPPFLNRPAKTASAKRRRRK
jgi:hypothetical protein